MRSKRYSRISVLHFISHIAIHAGIGHLRGLRLMGRPGCGGLPMRLLVLLLLSRRRGVLELLLLRGTPRRWGIVLLLVPVLGLRRCLAIALDVSSSVVVSRIPVVDFAHLAAVDCSPADKTSFPATFGNF